MPVGVYVDSVHIVYTCHIWYFHAHTVQIIPPMCICKNDLTGVVHSFPQTAAVNQRRIAAPCEEFGDPSLRFFLAAKASFSWKWWVSRCNMGYDG